jgi:FtsP/CotA-like multicopper oxidase with cupredoxin domain
MLVIAADAYSVRPIEINTLYSTSGERYDFVLDANQVSGKKKGKT